MVTSLEYTSAVLVSYLSWYFMTSETNEIFGLSQSEEVTQQAFVPLYVHNTTSNEIDFYLFLKNLTHHSWYKVK